MYEYNIEGYALYDHGEPFFVYGMDQICCDMAVSQAKFASHDGVLFVCLVCFGLPKKECARIDMYV